MGCPMGDQTTGTMGFKVDLWHPFPMNNWKHDEVFGRNFPIGGWGELVNLSRSIFSGSILLLCCFQLFGCRYSIHWYWQVLKKYVVFIGRARRNEYWMFHRCNALVFVIIPMISSATLAFIMEGDVELVLIVWGLSHRPVWFRHLDPKPGR